MGVFSWPAVKLESSLTGSVDPRARGTDGVVNRDFEVELLGSHPGRWLGGQEP